jgi:hypothetical protein
MKMRIVSLAREELEEITSYLDTEDPAIADRFYHEFEEAARLILSSPSAWPRLKGPIRRKRLRTFPTPLCIASIATASPFLPLGTCTVQPGSGYAALDGDDYF